MMENQGYLYLICITSQDDVLINKTAEPLLTLEMVEPQHRGLYHCIAVNSIGSSNQSHSGLLTINGK